MNIRQNSALREYENVVQSNNDKLCKYFEKIVAELVKNYDKSWNFINAAYMQLRFLFASIRSKGNS